VTLERNRSRDVTSIRAALAGTEWASAPDEPLEARRDELVADIESGTIAVEMPSNGLIGIFLTNCLQHSWVLSALNWTLVRTDGATFVLGDTPVSLYDPTPPYPGSAAGLLSSPDVETFIPLDPTFGILAKPPEDRSALFEAAERAADAAREDRSEERRAKIMAGFEGGWAERTATDELVDELNLRTYTHAQRFIFGSQQAASRTQRHARKNPLRANPDPRRLGVRGQVGWLPVVSTEGSPLRVRSRRGWNMTDLMPELSTLRCAPRSTANSLPSAKTAHPTSRCCANGC
jgi:uncharacterized protein DUF4238